MAWTGRIRQWAWTLKREVIAVWIAARDPRTPMAARILAGVVAAYALSPIDLIPDVIPVLGYLDDLVILPLGLALAIRLIPHDLMAEFRNRAEAVATRPQSRIAALVVIAIWCLLGWAVAILLLRHTGHLWISSSKPPFAVSPAPSFL